MIFRVFFLNFHTIRQDMNTQYEIFFIISFLAAFLMFGLAAYVSRFRKIQSVGVFTHIVGYNRHLDSFQLGLAI